MPITERQARIVSLSIAVFAFLTSAAILIVEQACGARVISPDAPDALGECVSDVQPWHWAFFMVSLLVLGASWFRVDWLSIGAGAVLVITGAPLWESYGALLMVAGVLFAAVGFIGLAGRARYRAERWRVSLHALYWAAAAFVGWFAVVDPLRIGLFLIPLALVMVFGGVVTRRGARRALVAGSALVILVIAGTSFVAPDSTREPLPNVAMVVAGIGAMLCLAAGFRVPVASERLLAVLGTFGAIGALVFTPLGLWVLWIVADVILLIGTARLFIGPTMRPRRAAWYARGSY